MTTKERIDLLIVGAGAAASVIAAKAAQAGKNVMMLEAGPKRSMSDLASSQIWARKLKWGGAPVEEQGDLKIGNNFNHGWGTGGSAMHHYGVWPRLHDVDFNLKSLYEYGRDWPFDYQQLRPYYDRIQTEVGISGDADQEKWRPEGKAYPMPPTPIFPQGKAIAKGFAKLGKHTAPIPLAINTKPYAGRPSCIYDGWCDAGCPTGALVNPLAHYLKIAFENGADVIHRATVSRLLCNDKGSKIEGVEYYDNDAKMQTIMADVVVLAANAIQNPRIMLASANSQHKNGVANSNDLVGRYLMTHPAKTVSGLFKEKTLPHMGATGGQLINQDSYDDKLAVKGAFGGYQWLIANAVKPNDLLGIANSRPDIFGSKLDTFMRKAAKHFATMIYVADDIPHRDNRVTLSKTKDAYGMALANTHHNLQTQTRNLTRHIDDEGLKIFELAGAEESWLGPPTGMHIMGGTIMGKSSADSVANDVGQTHEIGNLFIAGAGLFPSSGAVNPTFTLHALTLKTVDYMLDQWSALTKIN